MIQNNCVLGCCSQLIELHARTSGTRSLSLWSVLNAFSLSLWSALNAFSLSLWSILNAFSLSLWNVLSAYCKDRLRPGKVGIIWNGAD